MNASAITEVGEGIAEKLKLSSVRWFYKEKNCWTAFMGNDSLRLEEKHRLINEMDMTNTSFKQLKDEFILVRGNMYTVNLLKRKMFSIFYIESDDDNEEPLTVIRGTWFHNDSLLPLETEFLSNAIEDQHLKLFGSCEDKKKKKDTNFVGKMAHKLSKQLKLKIFTMDVNDYHIEWGGINDVFITKPSMKQYVLDKVGLGRVGNRICRGYHEAALMNDKYPNIDHLCFVIEGIGKTYGNNTIYEKVSDLIKATDKVISDTTSYTKQKLVFVPVNWPKSLAFNYEIFENISPDNNPGLRMIVNSSSQDILYYSNPLFYSDIIECLKSELNRVYSIFCHHNDYFVKNNGKISAIAHSLGSVILFDILCNWSPLQQYNNWKEYEMNSGNKVQSSSIFNGKSNETKNNVQKFQLHLFPQNDNEDQLSTHRIFPFQIENLFFLGSPLAIFLAFRGIKLHPNGLQEDLIKPHMCKRFYNIFHPNDPLVYRIEPLINEYYSKIRPVMIQRPNGESTLPLPSMSHRILYQPIVDDGTPYKSWDKRFVSQEIPEFYNVEYSDDENMTENIIKSFSNAGLETKETFDMHSSKSSMRGKPTTNFYYQKNMNIIERRNDSNVVYTIKAVSIHDSISRGSNYNENSLTNTGDRNKMQGLNNMNFSKNSSTIKHINTEIECQSDLEIHKTLKWRLDFKLPQNHYENSYFSALSSHESYWTDEDLSFFILSQIHKDPIFEDEYI